MPFTVDVNQSNLEIFIELVLLEGSQKTFYNDPFLFMKALKLEIAKGLTDGVLTALQCMQNGEEPGIVHFHGFPQDPNLPDGDSALLRSQNKTRISEAVILATAALMGCYLFSKETEQDGLIIHNVSPVKGKEHIVSSVGRDPFYYHTEIAYSRAIPKFLMLFCLEGDPEAKTSYFPINKILKDIPNEIKETMRKPIFQLSAVSGYDIETTITPLLSIDPVTNIEIFRFYQHVERIEAAPGTEETKKEATDCLEYLTMHAKKVFPENGEEPSVGLQQGEALLFNNGWCAKGEHHGVMHGRVGYIKNPNRWLQRSYFFDITPEISNQINTGYSTFLHRILTDKKIPLKLAIACLKTAITNTKDYRIAARENPTMTETQLFFHGVKPKPGAETSTPSWLQRIAAEDDTSSALLTR